jgi:hypothetical protein
MNSKVTEWRNQGCSACRASWESGSREGLRNIGTSYKMHTRLFRCDLCGAYWEELERYAHEISSSEAAQLQQHESFEPFAG